VISRNTFDRLLKIENEIVNLKHVQSNLDRRIATLEDTAPALIAQELEK